MPAPRIYLKKELQTNVPVLLKMRKRINKYPEKDFQTQQPIEGQFEYLYSFEDAQGRELTHYAKEYEEEVLKLFKSGDRLQVVRAEKTDAEGKRYAIHTWTPPEGSEAKAAANPQPASNTSMSRQAKQHDDRQVEEDKKWRRIDTSKIVFGYMNTVMARGVAAAEAAKIAKEAYFLQEGVVDEIMDSLSQAAS